VLSKKHFLSVLAACALLASAPTASQIEGNEASEDPAERIARARDHWAFRPIQNAALPKVHAREWVRNPIDTFILAHLEKENVKPSPEARRETLLRRVYLDIVGLPPGPAEVEAFLVDNGPDAYEQLVGELLASPHYGERWGRYWLDMARYADSDGFEQDRVRPHAWRWREWVINALNANRSFDRYSIEQLAGDLLPSADVEQQVATGFHRNTLINREGGIDGEEDRVKRTVDRTNTLGEVWLGMTIQCGQCHNHKYDPLAQSEYYGLYAFFNSMDEPDIPAPYADQWEAYQIARAAFDKEHAPYLERLAAYEQNELPRKVEEWKENVSDADLSWALLLPTELTSRTGTSFTAQNDGSIFAEGENLESDVYTLVATTSLKNITAFRLEVLTDERLPRDGPGRASNGNFVLTSFKVKAAPRDGSAEPRTIALQNPYADFSQGSRVIASAVGDDPNNGWAVWPRVGEAHYGIFETAENIGFEGGTRLEIEMHHALHHDHNIGRFRISAISFPRPVRPEIIELLRVPEEQLSEEQRNARTELSLHVDPKYVALTTAAAEHARNAPKNPGEDTKAQIITERSNPRRTQVHIRGDFLNKGDVVEPHAPVVLPEIVARSEKPDRLDLAHWLFTAEHPLTARVAVNRLWQQYFGQGIVVTDNDFGTQGDPPSHPELLDWLATKFRDSAWNLKALHRLIVTSATYRQSSNARPELAERDPLNAWLSRQNRLRAEAEVIRDLGLATSGLLAFKVGGPSVRPPQPEGVAELGFQNQVRWMTSAGEDIYRRGVYTHFQRLVPYPMLMIFDAPNSNTSCTRRDRSNTPLQALTLWNDPVFFDMAQALGRRVVMEAQRHAQPMQQTRGRIRHAFRLCLGRNPDGAEDVRLREFYTGQLAHFEADRNAASAATGDRPLPAGTDAAELAAWVMVGRAIMNLDEFITRD
jgi:hypothetical protein